MVTRRQREAKEVVILVTEWMVNHPCEWHRINSVAENLGLAIPKVNNALRYLSDMGVIWRDPDNRKPKNGKKYPTYWYSKVAIPECRPSWMLPAAPVFTDAQIKGVRTVLGFTGSREIKDSLK